MCDDCRTAVARLEAAVTNLWSFLNVNPLPLLRIAWLTWRSSKQLCGRIQRKRAYRLQTTEKKRSNCFSLLLTLGLGGGRAAGLRAACPHETRVEPLAGQTRPKQHILGGSVVR